MKLLRPLTDKQTGHQREVSGDWTFKWLKTMMQRMEESHPGSNSWQPVSFLIQLIPGWAPHLLGGSVKVNQHHNPHNLLRSQTGHLSFGHWSFVTFYHKTKQVFYSVFCLWEWTHAPIWRSLESRMMPTCCLYSPPLDSSTKKDWKNEHSICWYCHQATEKALLISCSWSNALWKNNSTPDNIDPNYMTINWLTKAVFISWQKPTTKLAY